MGLLIIIVLILIEYIYSPRIDRIVVKKDIKTDVITYQYILWYGSVDFREYIKLFKL